MTVLFLHGAGCTGQSFQAQVRAFPDAYAPNLPGHLCAGEPASITDFCAFVENFIASRSLREVVLCGHSMGGAIAIETALAGRVPLKGLVLLGSGAKLRVSPAVLAGLERAFEPAARSLAGYYFARPDAVLQEGAVDTMLKIGADQTLRDFRACDSFDALDRLHEISVPMLAMTGSEDRMTPPKYAQALAGRVPGAQARILTGAGHFIMVERPEETNAAVGAFLSEVA